MGRSRMARREPRYRVVIEGPTPEDLAERCAQVWIDIRLAAKHVVPAGGRRERHLGDEDSAGAGGDDDHGVARQRP